VLKNTTAKLYSIRKKAFLEMLRKMVEPLGEVCSVTRRLFRRGLSLLTSRHVKVFFPAKGQLLFEEATYPEQLRGGKLIKQHSALLAQIN
jgi:hypothetical protein